MAEQKAVDLFKAYAEGKLPSDGGYIVSSFLDEHSAYSRYEVIAYNGVKSIVLTNEGLTFQTDGNKIFVLAEPPNYAQKHLEPFRRTAKDQIPHRFSELDILTTKNQTKVMVSKSPHHDVRLLHHHQARRERTSHSSSTTCRTSLKPSGSSSPRP